MVKRDRGGHYPRANTIIPGSRDLKRRNSSQQNPSQGFSEELKVNLEVKNEEDKRWLKIQAVRKD